MKVPVDSFESSYSTFIYYCPSPKGEGRELLSC